MSDILTPAEFDNTLGIAEDDYRATIRALVMALKATQFSSRMLFAHYESHRRSHCAGCEAAYEASEAAIARVAAWMEET